MPAGLLATCVPMPSYCAVQITVPPNSVGSRYKSSKRMPDTVEEYHSTSCDRRGRVRSRLRTGRVPMRESLLDKCINVQLCSTRKLHLRLANMLLAVLIRRLSLNPGPQEQAGPAKALHTATHVAGPSWVADHNTSRDNCLLCQGIKPGVTSTAQAVRSLNIYAIM